MKRGHSLGDITSAMLDDNDIADGGAFTQVRGRRKKSKKAGAVQNQDIINSLIDDAIHSVVSQCSPSLESPSGVVHSQYITATSQQDIANVRSDVDIDKSLFASELSVLRRSVDELTNTVQSYRLIVDKLSSQLNCVMRYLDINLNTSDMESPNTATTAYKSSSNATVVKDTATASATYSGVASVASAARSTRPRPTSLKEAVVSVVQADQREKERRAKTVVVSGLKQDNTMSDADSFRRLSMLELGVDPLVKSTKRLGMAHNDRIQPVLVSFQSADQAADLIQRAKLLRRSTDEHVRTNVYINRNLTAVEAKLAYEERCRRRLHKSQQHHTGGQRYTDYSKTQSRQVSAASQSGEEFAQLQSSRVIVNSHLRRGRQLSDGGTHNNLSSTCSAPNTDIQHEGPDPGSVLRLSLPGATTTPVTISHTVDGRHR